MLMGMAPRNLQLLIIDPQNDFCDLPESYRPELASGARAEPALAVPGAHRDMLQVAQLIEGGGLGLTGITLTLDSHQHLDIAHPTFWKTGEGEPVSPFTRITAEDVRRERFVPRLEGTRTRVIGYLEQLEAQGRFQHMVWPVHCEVGSWGHNVHPALRSAYNAWEERTLRSVLKVTKGENPWTEHYSAIQAEVPDAMDPGTQFNRQLVDGLRQADRLFITGEAGSHCVKATTEHLVAALGPDEVKRLALVTDCMSSVAGFEAVYAQFLEDMRACGVSLMRAADVERELCDNAA
jgi:nicotinamidase/pyrazinamidase